MEREKKTLFPPPNKQRKLLEELLNKKLLCSKPGNTRGQGLSDEPQCDLSATSKKSISPNVSNNTNPPQKNKEKKKNKKSRFCMDRISLTLTKNQMLTCGAGKRIDKNTFLDVNCEGKSCRAHFFKKFFSEDKMLHLKDQLLQWPKTILGKKNR